MDTIVFINTYKSGSSREAIRSADRMGFFTVLMTDRKGVSRNRKEYPDVHQLIIVEDLLNLRMLRKEIKSLQNEGKEIKAILSFIDLFVYNAAVLHEEFCGKTISTEAIMKMEDKILTRQALDSSSYNPHYDILHDQSNILSFIERHKNDFPLMVKMPKSSGSRDVFKIKNEKRLLKCLTKLRKEFPNELILVEEYLEGPQYLVETLVYNNQIHIIAVIEQEISDQHRFIVTGYSLHSEMLEVLEQSLSKAVHTIINLMGMENGGCHLELRLVNNQWKLIEINPRISGGAMNRIIEVAYGINLVEETIKLIMGEEPSLQQKHKKNVFTQYVTCSSAGILERVTGKGKAYSYPGVEDVYVKPRRGTYLTPPLSMGHRYAYVIASGDTLDKARETAKMAADEIMFHLSE